MPVTTITSLSQYHDAIQNNKKIVFDFHAEWCGPCKLIGPKFEKFADEYAGIAYAQVDVDAVPDVAAEAEVRAMPTFVFYHNGKKVNDVVGANATKLEEAIKALVNAE
ncbi:thioredoxin [Lichtheimia ornata]|uniref:Thioredoxin n=1 Tax=Lichtheimia ornata TaxID=688661 RepID=A0AAD7UT36_9FUNG|nr:thioredoxin [Lichtheimia ornata]KAJ8652157.1 thioredoxin [Lichtheimia ornata]